MLVSDFIHSKTTHDLLLLILFSELGLYGVSSPSVQVAGVQEAFSPLRTVLTSDTSKDVWCETLDMNVDRAQDMLLFYDLYTSMNFMSAIKMEDAGKILDLCVYPVVGRMLVMSEAVRHRVEEKAKAHANHYGEIVTYRMNKTLKAFNVNSYIDLENTHA